MFLWRRGMGRLFSLLDRMERIIPYLMVSRQRQRVELGEQSRVVYQIEYPSPNTYIGIRVFLRNWHQSMNTEGILSIQAPIRYRRQKQRVRAMQDLGFLLSGDRNHAISYYGQTKSYAMRGECMHVSSLVESFPARIICAPQSVLLQIQMQAARILNIGGWVNGVH